MAEDIPRLVPVEVALNNLHDGAALTSPATYRDFDRATLDRLQRELERTGARVRGQIDDGRPDWITEFMDYELTYRAFPVPGKVWSASSLRCRTTRMRLQRLRRCAPVQGPYAVVARYRLVVSNLKVETERFRPKALSATPPAVRSPALDAPSIGSPAVGETEFAPDSPLVAAIKKRWPPARSQEAVALWQAWHPPLARRRSQIGA
jgi:hypothetical protein